VQYTHIPSADAFRRDLGVQSSGISLGRSRVTGFGTGADDRLLGQIYNLLREYVRTPGIQMTVRMGVLWRLCSVTQHWLKDTYLSQSSREFRKPPIQALQKISEQLLSTIFGCKPAGLSLAFQDYFGRHIDEGPLICDLAGGAMYLTADEVKKYRLMFRDGVAYMWTWYLGGQGRLMRAKANSRQAEAPGVITPGFAGYALGMDNMLYMARHSEGDHQKFAHSAYTAGTPVLCAGEIAIVEGSVVAVTTSSGHYKPQPEKMLHVLTFLRTQEVSLSNIIVGIRLNNGSCPYYTATSFMAAGANLLSPNLVELNGLEYQRILVSIPGYIEGLVAQARLWEPDVTVEEVMRGYGLSNE